MSQSTSRCPAAKCILAAVLVGVASCLAGTADAATVYDVAKDFSPTSNPNGVWTYGYETTLGGSFTVYDAEAVNGGRTFWTGSNFAFGGPPADFANLGNTDITSGTAPLAAHSAAFHPGPNGEFSIYRFTAPTDGTYSLATTFTGLDTYGTTTDVHVLYGSTQLFGGNINGYNDIATYSDVLTLAAGDTIDFAVGDGTDGSYYYDSTGIAATLTPAAVPLPSSALLMLTGVMGIGVAVGKRGRKGLNRR